MYTERIEGNYQGPYMSLGSNSNVYGGYNTNSRTFNNVSEVPKKRIHSDDSKASINKIVR